jgi:hypothetical protein
MTRTEGRFTEAAMRQTLATSPTNSASMTQVRACFDDPIPSTEDRRQPTGTGRRGN